MHSEVKFLITVVVDIANNKSDFHDNFVFLYFNWSERCVLDSVLGLTLVDTLYGHI